MRVIQITDLHIGREGEDTYLVDVRENFRRIIAAVQERRPDFLVLSGDLCYSQGELDIYNWIKPSVDQLNIPYEVMAGNHDDFQLVAKAFGRDSDLKSDGLYYTRTWEGKPIVFMDTSKYIVAEEQLAWVEAQLKQLKGDIVLFIHHPPLLVGMPFMDNNYALKDRNPLLDILSAYPGNIDVFCGHYHIDRTIRWKNLLVHVTPSCFFQIDSYAEDFKVDHYRIAFREISFLPELTISAVHYL
ncbi:metallophosphoesterase [Haliscomenobacter sp.]|uniref:metallophosphoesterase family protein n=1 Tax=Haliscomenobacter sp. TaxID=2717303 RepID=UPI0033650103